MTTTATLTLTDFLLARIAEDEVRATLRDWHTQDCETIPNSAGYSYPCDCGVPERMKRECEAKRRIVGIHEVRTGDPYGEIKDRTVYWCYVCDNDRDYIGIPHDEEGCPTIRALAAVYADHEHYREDWRP